MTAVQVPDHTHSTFEGSGKGIAAQATGLSKTYGEGAAKVTALDDVTVEFVSGQLTAIMGPSGSGKSTLMHCMAALDTPTAGHVTIDGVDITRLKDKALTRLRRDRLGFVFQAYNLIPTLSAQENITLPMDIAGAHVDPAWFDTVINTLGCDLVTLGSDSTDRSHSLTDLVLDQAACEVVVIESSSEVVTTTGLMPVPRGA